MNRSLRLTARLLLLLLASGIPTAQAASQRQVVAISDLHFGVGKQGNDWHPMEDFRWSEELAAFLNAVHACGNGSTDLLLNGDTFELWQSLLKGDCRVAESRDLSCSEKEAEIRMEQILKYHAADLQALGRFAAQGANQVVLVPGNHDAALFFPKVARMVLQAMAAPNGKAVLREKGFWLSDDHLVYAEHGHQMPRDPNLFSKWPQPFLKDKSNTLRLQRPWGEQMVQSFYNQYEEKYPLIDNLKGETGGLTLGLAAEGLEGTAVGAGRFLRFALFGVSWRQFVTSLTGQDGQPPQWNVDAIRESIGDRFFVDSVPNDDPLHAEMEKVEALGLLGLTLSDLTDDEIKEICDARWAILQTQLDHLQEENAGGEPTISPCPNRLSALTKLIPGYPGVLLKQRLQEVRTALETAHPGSEPLNVFIFGHTHNAEEPFFVRQGAWEPTVINTGAWQRLADREEVEKLRKGVPASQVLGKLTFDLLPACYSFVLIPPYTTVPIPKLRYWRRDASGTWGFANSCAPSGPTLGCGQ